MNAKLKVEREKLIKTENREAAITFKRLKPQREEITGTNTHRELFSNSD